MRAPPVAIATAALLCAAWWMASTPAGAKIVRGGRTASSNPAIEAGGIRLMTNFAAPVSYSLIGAIANDSHQFGSCNVWGWPVFELFSLQRHGSHGGFFGQPFSIPSAIRPLP